MTSGNFDCSISLRFPYIFILVPSGGERSLILTMSKTELLQQIRESERQNASSLEQAESDRQASLRKAQQDRAGLVEKARTKATKKAEKDFAKARKRIEASKQELLDDGLAGVVKIRKGAEKKRDKAAKQFVTRFLESFNA